MSEHFVTLFDTETTGLKPDYHEIIDIWVRRLKVTIELDGEQNITYLKYDKEAEYGSRVAPLYHSRIEPEARAINGFNNQDWRGAPFFPEVWMTARDLFDDATWVASFPVFDLRFISAACVRYEIPGLPKRVQVVDTGKMAWPLKRLGKIQNCKLGTIAQYFGLGEQEHTARGDVDLLEKVYFQLVRGQYWKQDGSVHV